MKRPLLAIAIVLLTTFPAFSQNVDKVEISDRDVVWDDFFKKVDTKSRFDA